MPDYVTTIIGFLMGFGFGVGCALAVMHSIYMGGYRKALQESAAANPSERLLNERKRLKLD